MNALIWYKADAIICYLQRPYGHPITNTEADKQAVIKFLETGDPETLQNFRHLARTILDISEFIIY